MKTYEECIPCFERQAADACALCGLDPGRTEAVLRAVRSRLDLFSCPRSPVEVALAIAALVRAGAHHEDPYRAIKERSNQACRDAMYVISECVAWAIDPFEISVKIAIAGNIIDYGAYAPQKLTRRDVVHAVQEALRAPIVGHSVERLAERVDRAQRILYIGDNAGECFLDTFLLGQLPAEKVTYVVRGGPVLNDATLHDARVAGIHKRCPIIDTGDRAPGVLLGRCSPRFRKAFQIADLVIAKGQGNYESLSDTPDKTCAFLTKVKCPVIAADIGFAVGSNVLHIVDGGSRNMEQESTGNTCRLAKRPVIDGGSVVETNTGVAPGSRNGPNGGRDAARETRPCG
jgi:uncharacterized protein with ATP-grasp and redox domains